MGFAERRRLVTVWILATTSLGLAIGAGAERWLRPGTDPAVLVRFVLPSLLLSGVAAALWGRRTPPDPPAQPESIPRAVFVLLAAAVLIAGAVLRVLGARAFPPPDGTGYEETEMASMAWELVRMGTHPPEHWIPTWVTALSFRLLGPGIPELRVPFWLTSALSPFFLLLAARRVASREVALLVTAFWSIAWWPILAGRIADEIYFTAPLQLVALALLFGARDRGSVLAAWGAGVLSGLFLTEYTAYRVFAPIVVAAGFVSSFRDIVRERRAAPGHSWRDCLRRALGPRLPLAGAFLLSLSAFAVPVAALAVKDRSATLAEGILRHTRVEASVLRLPGPEYRDLLRNRISNLWEATHVEGRGETSPWINPDQAPMVDQVTFAVLAAGLVVLVLTAGRRRHGILLALLVVPVAAFLAVPGNENFMRYFVVLPVAFLGAAAGLDAVFRLGPAPVRYLLMAAGTGALVLAVRPNLDRVFQIVPSSETALVNYREVDTVLALWTGQRPETSTTVFVTDTRDGEFPDNDACRWLIRGRRTRMATTLSDALSERPLPGSPVHVVATGIPEIPGFAELLNRFVGPVTAVEQLTATDPHQVSTVWTIEDPSAETLPRTTGDVLIRTWVGPTQPAGSGDLPAPPVEPRFTLRGPDFSVMAIPLKAKWDFMNGPGPDGLHLWAALDGVPDRAAGENRALEVQVRNGEAWLLAGDSVIGTVRAPNWWVAVCVSPPPAGTRLRLLYRHDGPGRPGVQLVAVGGDGHSRVATAIPKAPLEFWLTDLKPVAETWDFAPPKRNRSAGGDPIRVDGLIRQDGLGFHAPGRATWEVPRGAVRFVAVAALQPIPGGCADKKARLRLLLDDVPVFDHVLSRAESGVPLSLDVQSARLLTVVIEEGDDSRDCDHVNLAEPRFVGAASRATK